MAQNKQFENKADILQNATMELGYNDTSSEDKRFDHEDDTINLINRKTDLMDNDNGTNKIYTVFLIVNAALGAGLLNFPKSVDEAGGVMVTIIVQLILLTFIMVALLALAYASDQCGSGAGTIQDTMEGMTGRFGRVLTSACVVIYTFGTTITFLIIIGDQFDNTFKNIYGSNFNEFWYMNRYFTTSLCACLFILPLCYSKRIDFLRIPSSLGVLAIFYLVGLIIYEYYFGSYTPGEIKQKPIRYTDAFLVVPDICFGYQCHVSVIPIYSCMKKRTLKNFTHSVSLAILICACCYTLSAVYGYWTFGSKVDDDVLMSYNGGSLVYAGMYAMALKIITTYPILLFCGREAVKSVMTDINIAMTSCSWSSQYANKGSNIDVSSNRVVGIATDTNETKDYVINRIKERNNRMIDSNLGETNIYIINRSKEDESRIGMNTSDNLERISPRTFAVEEQFENKKEITFRYVCVTIWFGLSLILALLIPNIGDVIKMLGSLAAVFIFIFPGLCMFKIALKFDPYFLYVKSCIIIAISFIFMGLGGFIFGVVFVQAIKSLLLGD